MLGVAPFLRAGSGGSFRPSAGTTAMSDVGAKMQGRRGCIRDKGGTRTGTMDDVTDACFAILLPH